MRRLVTVCGFLVLCGPWAACSPPFAIFEDVGTDPHPPQVEIVGVAFQPGESETGVPLPADLQPAEGFVVRPFKTGEDTLLIRVRFSDFGGDVQNFTVRDRDGTLSTEVVPVAPEVDLDNDGVIDTAEAPAYFSGTSGTFDLEEIVIDAAMVGPHRMELWAEDSHESRSEKVTFTIQVAL